MRLARLGLYASEHCSLLEQIVKAPPLFSLWRLAKVQSMQSGCLPIVGLILGAMLGAMLGVGLGFAYTKIFNVSNFEGYSGMLVFYTFMPIGAIAGGLGGSVV